MSAIRNSNQSSAQGLGSAPTASDWHAGLGLLLVLLTFLAYANTLRVPLLFDDEPAISKNESIRQLSTAFSPPRNGEPVTGRPVLNASFALNHALTGMSLPGYHVTNILIHALAAVVLFGVIRRTLHSPGIHPRFAAAANGIAWFSAALWALHPIQTESVTYLSQRAESLVGLFYLLTLYAFIRANDPSSSHKWAWLAWIACFAGMATKEVMVTAPVVVLLYDRTFISGSFRGVWQKNGRLYLALGSTWIALGYLVASNAARGGTVGFSGHLTWWSYLCTQSYALVRYLSLSIFPHPLVFDYGTLAVNNVAVVGACGAGVLALLGITMLGVARRPKTGFFGVWFFAILAPTSSLVPVITQTIAEHRMYLPLAAITTGATLLLWSLPPKMRYCSLSVLVLSAGVLTWHRNGIYKSEISVWEDTVTKRPENPRALNNLGLLYVKQKRYEEAISCLTKVLTLDPSSTEANYNLGYALSRLGRDEDALKYYEAALATKADNTDALINYGAALLRLGRTEQSITQNRAVLRVKPDLAEAQHNLGVALLVTGAHGDALQHLRLAFKLAPGDVGYARKLATTLEESGLAAEAIETCEVFLRNKPSADFYTYLGVLRAKNRQLEKARDAFLAALRLDPAHIEAQQNLARARSLLERGSAPK